MITQDTILAPIALHLIDPAINYRKSSGTCQEILDTIFTGELILPSECVDAIIANIETMALGDVQNAIQRGAITHDAVATSASDKTAIIADGVDFATITTGLNNAYVALCYLDGVCESRFSDTGTFEFACLDSGAWDILFIDKTTYQTSAISITA